MTSPRRYRHASLVAQLGAAKDELDKAQAAYDLLADRARTELGFGHHVDGDIDVLITRNRSWDKLRAAVEWGEQICTLQVDLSQAREVMTGHQFESYYIDNEPRVVVQHKSDPPTNGGREREGTA